MSLIALALVACQRQGDTQYAEYFVFGTAVTVAVRTGDDAAPAFAQLGTDFQRMHADWHPWEAGALGDLNRALAEGRWMKTAPDLIELIEASQRMETLSGGRFNAAVGALVALWGFHTSDYPITEPPPARDDIDRLLSRRPSAHDIELDGTHVRSRNRATRLDFGGIAKGLAVRLACERLAEFSITDAMVNAGGDVMVCGTAKRPWRIAVRDPAGDSPLEVLQIATRLAVFTSGNYHRYGQWEGQRYAHILDPATGYPVNDVLQATVIHPDPVLADAAATALVVAGSENWREVAAAMRLERAMVLDKSGGWWVVDGG